ncbi:unnamed protein product [Caenorhabditis auriculariae]|uniref:PDZ domain-containing protein n=1 Tax=Caenorhabditis auriculariae TaxID=2777116 RepID=A0A8S1HUR9_9PELO|nr:unnamed protein product [Caenorhabditis auriculariae]
MKSTESTSGVKSKSSVSKLSRSPSLLKAAKPGSGRTKKRRDASVAKDVTVDATADEDDKPISVYSTIGKKPRSGERPPFNFYNVVKVVIPEPVACSFLTFVDVNFNMGIERVRDDLCEYLIHGDQILDLNGMVTPCLYSLSKALATPPPYVFTVLRVWNIEPPTKTQMEGLGRNESTFLVNVYVHKLVNKHGFSLKMVNKKITVVGVLPRSNGGYAFCAGDRLIDFDGSSTSGYSIQNAKSFYNTGIKNFGYCQFLVERTVSLRSSPNPSVFAEVATSAIVEKPGSRRSKKNNHSIEPPSDEIPPKDYPLEYDAVEIGCREATRFLHVNNNHLFTKVC